MGKGGGDFGLFQPNILCKIERFAAACRQPETTNPLAAATTLGPSGDF